jgi:hypothetical protein
MNESMNVFGQLANMPNIAKNYLFRIRFWSYKDEKFDNELMLRAKRIFNESYITFDEFEDFYVSKLFDGQKEPLRYKIFIDLFDDKLQECKHTKEFTADLEIQPIAELDQEASVKLRRTVKLTKV